MKPCACGKLKCADRVVCTECWQAWPLDCRIQFTSARPADCIVHARRLIEFARSRRQVKPVKPSNLQLALA